jgi:hypothetical protein
MFVHSVYFWLKTDLSEADLAAFREGLESLRKCPTVKYLHLGTPPRAERPVVDDSFSVGLVTVFDDRAGHDAYQVDEVHNKFVADHSGKWDRVLIYDMA